MAVNPEPLAFNLTPCTLTEYPSIHELMTSRTFPLISSPTYQLMNSPTYELNNLPTYELIRLRQHLTKGADPGPKRIKVGHGQFKVNEGNRNTGIFDMFHELRPVKGIGFTEFDVPE